MFVGGHSNHLMHRELHSRALPTVETLFPLTTGVSHWTTLPGAPNALPFDSTTLNPVKTIGALGINYVDTVPGGGDRRAIHVHFPAGSYTLNSDPRGGISFYSHGPDAKDVTGTALLTNAKEATFGYSVYFPPTFDFVKGGKLPGFFGGNTQDGSYSCSGGRKDTTCFSARLMWRENGDGEIYAYFPAFDEPGFATNKDLCDLPNNVCDPTYGISLGRGNFTFPKGAWTTVAQRVKLNDPGQANGEVELFVDGKSVIKSDKILMVDHTAESRIRGLQVQSFFGGSTIEWAPKTDQDLYFADFSVAVTEEYKTPPTAAAPPSGSPPSGNSNTGGGNNGTNTNGNGSQGGKPDAAVGLKVNKGGLLVVLMGFMALLVGA